MAVIAAPSTSAISPQVDTKTIVTGSMHPVIINFPGHVIPAPVLGAAVSGAGASGHAVGG